jgi:rubrerythrin
MEDILKKNEEKKVDISALVSEGIENTWVRWKCLVCGYVYEGVVVIKRCPKCGNEDHDKFVDAE